MEPMKVAIVLAAGQGKRMGTKTAKQFLELAGKPVLSYSLKAFEESEVDGIVLVTSESEMEYCRTQIVEKYGITKVIGYAVGGKERYHSVYHGICKCQEFAQANRIEIGTLLIHDGARPFVTPDMIHGLIKETKRYGACVSATKVKDTIKIADEEGFCTQTPKRSLVWAVQTPQVFSYALIRSAYQKLIVQEDALLAQGIQVTDDAMVAETMQGQKIRLVEGSYQNIKLTTPDDLIVAEGFIS